MDSLSSLLLLWLHGLGSDDDPTIFEVKVAYEVVSRRTLDIRPAAGDIRLAYKPSLYMRSRVGPDMERAV